MYVLEVIEFADGLQYAGTSLFGNVLSIIQHARNGCQGYTSSPGDLAHCVRHRALRLAAATSLVQN